MKCSKTSVLAKIPTLALTAACLLSQQAVAETKWSDDSISLLYGSDYQIGEGDRTTMTYEHASAHNWGDVFFFVDRLQSQDEANDKETYGELSPRLSLSYLTGNKLAAGPVTDVYLAGTYEFDAVKNGPGFDNYLYGIGLDWQVPGFQYFQSQFYYAKNETTKDDLQMTLVWGSPWEFGGTRVLFDGYIDWSSAASDHASEFHFNPQLKLDIGNYFGIPRKFYAGVEYSYWSNKFGQKNIPGLETNENLFSALIKVHF